MADLLPSIPDAEPGDEPRVIGIDSDDAEDLLAALSSDTARRILAALHDDPTTPSRLAERVDTSLQNAQYHLERLESAGVVEVADTAYSEKGREMNVYAPADRALVVVAGSDDDAAGLETGLSRLLGGVGALGVASLLLDRLLREPGGPAVDLWAGSSSDAGSGGAAGGGGSGDGGGAEDFDAAATDSPATETETPSVETETPVETEAPPAETETPEAAEATPAPTEDSDGGVQIADADTPTPESTATETPVADAAPTPEPSPTPTPDSNATATPDPETISTAAETVATTDATPVLDAFASASPGLLFFLGGTTVLVTWFAFWLVRRAN